MACAKCGAYNANDAFCVACGTRLAGNEGSFVSGKVAANDIVVVPPGARSKFQAILQCPVGPELARRAMELAADCYGRDTVPPERFEQLREKNSNILACLTSVAGDFWGYFDLVPLKPDFARMLLSGGPTASASGKATGRAISDDDVFGMDEMEKCTNLYISGIAVRQPNKYSGRRHASMLVWGFWKYVERFYPPDRIRHVFAVAATESGENLLRKFNFSIYGDERDRRGKHRRYILLLSPETLSCAFNSLPDWSTICGLTWARP